MNRFYGVVAALWFATSCIAQNATTSPDLVLRNGHIYTGDAARPWVEAVSVRGGRVVATGTDATIDSTSDAHTRVIDLQGRMAMPGINDAHDHKGGAHYGVEARLPPPQGPEPNPSIEEVAAAVKLAANSAPPGEWIHAVVGAAVIRHGREASLAMDEAAPDHPVLLDAVTGHGVVLNRAGMAKVGITDAVKDPLGGHYERDADGKLTGLLEESAGNAVKQRLSSEMGIQPAVTEFRAYAQKRLQQGVTSVQIMGTNQKLSALMTMLLQADTPLRVRVMRFPLPEEDARNGEQQGSGEEVLSPMVRVAGVKYVLDGTPVEELAFQTKEYADRPGWRGRVDYPVSFIDAQLELALTGKDQLLMHVVGDGTANEVLDEMEKLAPAARWRPLRVRFEHGDGQPTAERIAREKKLGIVIAQPRPGVPWKDLVAAGIPLAYGSDSGLPPWLMFSIMTDPKNPEAMTKEEALNVMTSGPALAEFQETKKGTLRPGLFADIAVLSQDVTGTTAAPLPSTHSVLTIVGGQIVYQSPEMAAGQLP